MARRKPAARTKPEAFQVRMTTELFDKFNAMVESLQAEKNSQGLALTKTDLIEYWATWMTGLSRDEQVRWTRGYRDDFMDQIKRGNPGAESDAAAVKGGHTVGRVRSLDDDVQPGKDRRPKRNKMDSQSAR